MLVGRRFGITLLVCAGIGSAAADRATAQVAVVGGSSTFITPGMTVGSIGPWSGGPWSGGPWSGSPWSGGYRGFSIGYGGGSYGTSYYSSGYGGGWGGGYIDDGFWGGGGWGGAPYWGGYGGYYALPPLVLPAETIYGPGPVRRLMGLDPPLGTPIVNNTIINLPSQAQGFGVLAPGQQAPPRAGVRPSNAQARDLAKRQITAGDTLFAKQQYAQALEAYKQAMRAAPDLADSHFRQMVALVALGRYDAAVDAVKSGMRISKETVNGHFRIPAMYGDNVMARTAHLETLAKLTAERPSSDLFFLAGVMLFFDNPPQRSAPFFEQAAQLAVVEHWHIDVFREVLKRLAQVPGANGQAANGPVANGPAPNGAAANGPAPNGPAVGAPVPMPPADGPAKRGVFRVPPPADADGGREI
jgi:hypothetical protein